MALRKYCIALRHRAGHCSHISMGEFRCRDQSKRCFVHTCCRQLAQDEDAKSTRSRRGLRAAQSLHTRSGAVAVPPIPRQGARSSFPFLGKVFGRVSRLVLIYQLEIPPASPSTAVVPHRSHGSSIKADKHRYLLNPLWSTSDTPERDRTSNPTVTDSTSIHCTTDNFNTYTGLVDRFVGRHTQSCTEEEDVAFKEATPSARWQGSKGCQEYKFMSGMRPTQESSFLMPILRRWSVPRDDLAVALLILSRDKGHVGAKSIYCTYEKKVNPTEILRSKLVRA